jgi:hypothetical protein
VNEGLPVERLRGYLRELPPEARALLVAELERSILRGENVPGAQVILQELRPALRRAVGQPSRLGNPARLFFRPLEPFLVSRGGAAVVALGRIERGCLTPIWEWLGRDLMPERARAYSDQVATALLSGAEHSTEQLARTFQDVVAQSIGNLITRVEGDDKAKRRVSAQIGTPRALQDIHDLFVVFRNREALAQIGARLPAHIRNLADEQLENVTALVRPLASSNPDLLPFALVLAMSRLSAHWQLIRVAIRSAESDAAARVAQAPLAPAVILVLADVHDTFAELRGALKEARIPDSVVFLKDIHDAIRGLRSEMDLSGDSPWARELAALRTEVSRLLEGEIATMPGRLRRLLRPPGARETAAGVGLDPAEVAELEARIGLAEACRNYASELAINQIGPRIYAELQNQIDTGTPALLDGLRAAGPADRKYRQSQVDAAVRFARKLFGADYAGLLAKAAAAAGSDHKVAARA